MLFKPSRFTWTEPRRARARLGIASVRRESTRILRLAAVFAALLMVVALFHVALRGMPLRPRPGILVVFVVSTGGLFLFFTGLSILPISVRIYEDRFVLDFPSRSRPVPFDAVSYCELTREHLTDRNLPVFNIYNRMGTQVASVLWDGQKQIPELQETLTFSQIELRNRL